MVKGEWQAKEKKETGNIVASISLLVSSSRLHLLLLPALILLFLFLYPLLFFHLLPGDFGFWDKATLF